MNKLLVYLKNFKMADMNCENIVWNDTEYKLKFVLDNPNFALPQIVRIVQGHMVDEDDSIASGQILTLHGKRKIETCRGSDSYGKDVNIPINCPYRIRIISLGQARQFTSVNELCFCENPPKFVRIEKELVTGNDVVIKNDVILEILDHVLAESGAIIGINCRPDTSDSEIITLPMNLKAIFLEAISSVLSQKSFPICELLKEYPLPIQVQFLPVTERNCGYGPHLGDLSLEKKITSNCILATSVTDGIRHAMTFSADLPITIQLAKGILNNRPSHIEDKVDLKRFDYLPSDPYSSNVIQDRIYDELKTPMLPRREPRLKRQNSTFSNYSMSTTHTTSFIEEAQKHERVNVLDTKRKAKSIDLGKKFVKSKLGFKALKKLRSKSKDKSESKAKSIVKYDMTSSRTFLTSDDGVSSAECSIDIRSNGSDSAFNNSFTHTNDTYNTSFNNIAQCMDAMSLDNQSVPTIPRRHGSRKGSSDSGICLSGRKQNRSRSRSRSRLTPDTPSSYPSDNNTFDNLSEWSIPAHVPKDSPVSERKSVASLGQKSSASYLWAADDDINNKKVEEPPLSSNQNFNYIAQNDGDNHIEPQQDLNSSPLTIIQIKSMDEIRALNEEGVNKILETLKLDEFKERFQDSQVNGELLLDLEQQDLVSELNLSLFQAKKLIKYVKGWRPEDKNIKPSETSRRNSLNPRDWSENDVLVHMTTINLIDLGHFCKANQVNGDLLLDILDKETLLSLKQDHNVNMSNLESKKLLNFVVKGWRPDSSPKKTAST